MNRAKVRDHLNFIGSILTDLSKGEGEMAEVYTSSRFSSGNLLFPASISVQPDGVHYEKQKLLGSSEEVISYTQISSIKIENGIIWTSLRIETSGGSQPILITGLSKNDGKAIRESLQKMQVRP
jgi:hypothetical protein